MTLAALAQGALSNYRVKLDAIEENSARAFKLFCPHFKA